MTPTPAPQPVSKPALTASGQPVRWTRWHTVGQLAIVIAIGVVGVVAPNFNVSMLATWIIVVALFLIFLFIVGAGITGRPQGLLSDERNKMSL